MRVVFPHFQSPNALSAGSSAVTFTLDHPSPPPPELQLNGSTDMLNSSMPSIVDGLTASNSILSDNHSRASTPDMLTAYQRETECNLVTAGSSPPTIVGEAEVTGSDGSDAEEGHSSPPDISTDPPKVQVDGETTGTDKTLSSAEGLYLLIEDYP